MRFDIDEFVADCVNAVEHATTSSGLAVKEVMDRAFSDPAAVAAAFGEAALAEMDPIHHSPRLTILRVVWGPGMSLPPHDHRMWAAIGIYGGREDNTFYRRDDERGLERLRGTTLTTGDTVLLGDKTVHEVHNPAPGYTGAIHVYGGDFLNEPRSEWDVDVRYCEHPSSGAAARQRFVDFNAAHAAPHGDDR